MRMFRKIICAALAACLLASLSAGCTSKKDENTSNGASGSGAASVTSAVSGAGAGTGAYKDGVYTAEGDYDDQGYKPVVKATVTGGKLTALDCDEVKEDGSGKKALSESGQYGMKAGGAQAEWHEEVALFEKAAVEKGLDAISFGSDGKTDAISGCTIKVSHFASLARQALQQASK